MSYNYIEIGFGKDGEFIQPNDVELSNPSPHITVDLQRACNDSITR